MPARKSKDVTECTVYVSFAASQPMYLHHLGVQSALPEQNNVGGEFKVYLLHNGVLVLAIKQFGPVKSNSVKKIHCRSAVDGSALDLDADSWKAIGLTAETVRSGVAHNQFGLYRVFALTTTGALVCIYVGKKKDEDEVRVTLPFNLGLDPTKRCVMIKAMEFVPGTTTVKSQNSSHFGLPPTTNRQNFTPLNAMLTGDHNNSILAIDDHAPIPGTVFQMAQPVQHAVAHALPAAFKFPHQAAIQQPQTPAPEDSLSPLDDIDFDGVTDMLAGESDLAPIPGTVFHMPQLLQHAVTHALPAAFPHINANHVDVARITALVQNPIPSLSPHHQQQSYMVAPENDQFLGDTLAGGDLGSDFAPAPATTAFGIDEDPLATFRAGDVLSRGPNPELDLVHVVQEAAELVPPALAPPPEDTVPEELGEFLVVMYPDMVMEDAEQAEAVVPAAVAPPAPAPAAPAPAPAEDVTMTEGEFCMTMMNLHREAVDARNAIIREDANSLIDTFFLAYRSWNARALGLLRQHFRGRRGDIHNLATMYGFSQAEARRMVDYFDKMKGRNPFAREPSWIIRDSESLD